MNQIKNIDFESWGGIDGFLRATSGGAVTRASSLKSVVPWLAKAVSMTSNAVASLPFDVVNESGDVIDTSTDWGNVLGGIESPRRLLALVAGALCGGSAYLIPMRTSRRLIDLQYAAPHTITPYIDYTGLKYFDRTTDKGQFEKIDPENLIYFWLPDSDVEIGCPLTSPMSSSLIAAELLASMSSTMKIYGDRGFVPAYIGKVTGMPTDAEKKKAENYLTRFLQGAYSSVVKLINAEKMELQRVGAGMEELKGAYTEIQQQAIEDIGTAFGIPAALFMSDKSFASEVNSLTRTWYETSVFVSIYQTIEEVFNNQIYNHYGARMQFKPESLSIFQEDEQARASAVTAYTNAINTDAKTARFVMSFMGVDLDEEQEAQLDQLIADKEEAAEEMQEQTQPNMAQDMTQEQPQDDMQEEEPLSPDETKDLALWYSKAKAWNLKGKGNAVDWENKHLRETIAAPIRLRLADAKNELDIVKAFELRERITPAPQYRSEILMLAQSINRSQMKRNEIIVNAIERVPNVLPHVNQRARYIYGVSKPTEYKTYDYMQRAIIGLVRGVYSGLVGGDFIDTMANLISGQLTQAYQQALEDEGYTDFALPEYLADSLEKMILNQYDFVDQYYRDIVDARIDGTSIDPLLMRADMWANRWNEAYNEAVRLLTLEAGGNLIWRYGEAEHCETCRGLNGIVASAKEWEEAGVRPQSAPNPLIDCGGWQCQCSLEPTDARRSPKALERILGITYNKSMNIKGGDGSGNFGHAGRPGEVGGSAPSGEGDGGVNNVSSGKGDEEMGTITNGEIEKRVSSAIQKLKDDGLEFDEYGLRFENKIYSVGDIVDPSKHNPDRQDERDFPEYGSSEYNQLPTLDGSSAWSINMQSSKDNQWKNSFMDRYNTADKIFQGDAKHIYIIGSNRSITHADADENETVLVNAVVVAVIR